MVRFYICHISPFGEGDIEYPFEELFHTAEEAFDFYDDIVKIINYEEASMKVHDRIDKIIWKHVPSGSLKRVDHPKFIKTHVSNAVRPKRKV